MLLLCLTSFVFNCLSLQLFMIKLLILLLLFRGQSFEFLYMLKNKKITKFNTLQFYLFLKSTKLNSCEIWLVSFCEI